MTGVQTCALPIYCQPPAAGYLASLGLHEVALLDQVLSCAAIGSPETVREELADFVSRTCADELMITSQIFDHAARLRSYEITAEVQQVLA